MDWQQVTYYTREGAIGAVRCTLQHLEETKIALIQGGSQVLSIKPVQARA